MTACQGQLTFDPFRQLEMDPPAWWRERKRFSRCEFVPTFICSAMTAQSVPSEESGIKVAALLSALLTPGSSDGWKNAPIAFSKKTLSWFFAQEE
jgi:hypothetical protein